MTQAVNSVKQPKNNASDNQPPSRLRTFLPALPNYRLILIVVVILALLTGCVLAAFGLYHTPPSTIIVDSKGLSKREYKSIYQLVQAQGEVSFFTSDLAEIKRAIIQLPWVNQVEVQRDWHRGIVVTVLPRQAVAKFGSERLIDATGVAYIPADSRELQRLSFVNLQGDADQSTLIMHNMQQVNTWFAPMDMQVQDMILTPRMTWIIRFNNDMRVIVDKENTSQKLLGLSLLLNNQLQNRRNQIQSVDLRYKNGFAIAWKTDNIAPLPMLEVPEPEEENENL